MSDFLGGLAALIIFTAIMTVTLAFVGLIVAILLSPAMLFAAWLF